MGLDMYLYKKTYVKQWAHQRPEEKIHVSVIQDGKPLQGINPNRIAFIVEEVAYWRKFNALHKWFVDNVQNGVDECQESYVSNGDIKKLLSSLKIVLDNKSLAGEILPTASGFFFGSTDYDEYYYSDVEETITILEALLEEDPDADFYYRSSW